ncbi:MAG: hypothetical protein ABR498_04825 [Candidatus Dormibacteria bacterium]
MFLLYIALVCFLLLMAVAGTNQSIAPWRGRIVVGRTAVDRYTVLRSKTAHGKLWWGRLRCAPVASIGAWGCVMASPILFRPRGCYSTGCEAIIALAVVGVALLLFTGILFNSVYFLNKPRFLVAPRLRNEPGALAWDRGERGSESDDAAADGSKPSSAINGVP